MLRGMREQRETEQKDHAVTQQAWDQHLMCTIPVKNVQDTQVSEEDNAATGMDLDSDKEQSDKVSKSHRGRPRR